MKDIVVKARLFAAKKHKNHRDKSGEPYFAAHLVPVAKMLSVVTKDKHLIAASYLHDTLEDTDTTYSELAGVFGKRVADLVNEVTKVGSGKNKRFPRLKSRKAVLIKFADKLSNLSRMKGWKKSKIASQMKNAKFWRVKKPQKA